MKKKLLYIKWIGSIPVWKHSKAYLGGTPHVTDVGDIESVGWLVDETEDCIRLTASIDKSDGSFGDVWEIPRAAIKKMQRVNLFAGGALSNGPIS